MTRHELTRFPLIKALLKNRWPQLAVYAALLAGFIFAIFAGFVGSPVGNHNFSIVFVWIAWWAMLILAAVPFFGRGWCAVCPIPLPGEWLQRGAILELAPTGKGVSLGRRWPNPLRNIWMQNISFTLVALFSSVILTMPLITAVVLSAMFFLAIGSSMVFERRAFCRYLCPVGGFIGLYSQIAPLELRVKTTRACASCKEKPCYHGSEAGYGCPWQVFPGGLQKNSYCGLCMECLRTCPVDNIAVNLRPFSSDLATPTKRLDEAFKAFIMVGAALIYAGVLLGPWGALKDAAYRIGSGVWFAYVGVFLSVLFVLMPSLYALAVKAGMLLAKTSSAVRPAFAAMSAALVPLGLMFWVAFSLGFVFTNATYILAALSDPLGWGWNLFGTANIPWQPLFTGLLAPLQTLVLIAGMLWSAETAQKVASAAGVRPLPVIIYCLLATLVMLGLLL
ncbi:MAG: 4Fe-4S binding protein [Chloroflexi bacterium]|nr:4Fe-4S binding protein [Chloroflexota bacterium]